MTTDKTLPPEPPKNKVDEQIEAALDHEQTLADLCQKDWEPIFDVFKTVKTSSHFYFHYISYRLVHTRIEIKAILSTRNRGSNSSSDNIVYIFRKSPFLGRFTVKRAFRGRSQGICRFNFRASTRKASTLADIVTKDLTSICINEKREQKARFPTEIDL